MKKYLLLITLLISTVLSAQEFSITRFTEAINDSTALSSPRYDFNDDICAALIVEIVSMNDISFTGNIIGDISKKGDRYLLYLTNGTKRIKLMHEDYLPMTVDFTQFNISIKGGHTYELLLSANKPQNQDSSYGSGAQYLIFKSSVPLTKVIVNGEEWPIVDGKAKKMVPLGKYEYVVEASELTSRGEAEVKSTATSKVVNIRFE